MYIEHYQTVCVVLMKTNLDHFKTIHWGCFSIAEGNKNGTQIRLKSKKSYEDRGTPEMGLNLAFV